MEDNSIYDDLETKKCRDLWLYLIVFSLAELERTSKKPNKVASKKDSLTFLQATNKHFLNVCCWAGVDYELVLYYRDKILNNDTGKKIIPNRYVNIFNSVKE